MGSRWADHAVSEKPVIKGKSISYSGKCFFVFLCPRGGAQRPGGFKGGFPSLWFLVEFQEVEIFIYIYIIKIVSNVYTFRVGESFIFKAFRA
jgi:hypothetical protein